MKLLKNKIILKAVVGLLAIVAFCGVCILGGCGGQDAHQLIMGCSADYPPFEFRKNGELVGVEVDIAKAVSQRLGYELEIQDMHFNSLIAALNSGTIDFAMSAMTVTEERKKHVDFSENYYVPKFSVLYRKGSEPISEVGQLAGKRVGVQLGTTMEMFVKGKAKELVDMSIKSLSKNGELIQELKTDRLDAIVIEASQTEHFVKANEDLDHSILKDAAGEGYAVAFPQGSKIRGEFERALVELKESGELEAIFKKWSI